MQNFTDSYSYSVGAVLCAYIGTLGKHCCVPRDCGHRRGACSRVARQQRGDSVCGAVSCVSPRCEDPQPGVDRWLCGVCTARGMHVGLTLLYPHHRPFPPDLPLFARRAVPSHTPRPSTDRSRSPAAGGGGGGEGKTPPAPGRGAGSPARGQPPAAEAAGRGWLLLGASAPGGAAGGSPGGTEVKPIQTPPGLARRPSPAPRPAPGPGPGACRLALTCLWRRRWGPCRCRRCPRPVVCPGSPRRTWSGSVSCTRRFYPLLWGSLLWVWSRRSLRA